MKPYHDQGKNKAFSRPLTILKNLAAPRSHPDHNPVMVLHAFCRTIFRTYYCAPISFWKPLGGARRLEYPPI